MANPDDGFAMLSVVMLLIVMTVLSLVVLAVVLSQVNPTLFTEKNARTLTAAQAGLDAAASQVRNAVSDDGSGRDMGDIHKLPCTVQGTVDGTGGETSYIANIQYFVEDPAGQDQEWRDDEALTCYTGTGINGGVRAVPRYALITSEGFDATSTTQVGRADRVVEATYVFQLTTRKVSGGMILDDNSNFCLVAASASVGANIYYRNITSADCQDQTDFNSWTWADDYMIHLSANDLDGKIPLCLSGRASGSAIIYMTLQVCTTSTQDPLGQRFSWTGDHTWRGQNASNTALAATYIVNQDSSVGAGDRLSVTNASTYKSITPLPAVGKGNASYLTNQVVNYQQFGRCLDVTNASITYAFMIAYPCKQDPSGNGAFDWNHKWFYNEVADGQASVATQIKVNNGSEYCLITTSSNTNVGNNPTGSFMAPRFVTSSNNADCSSNNTRWTRYGYSTDPNVAYTIQDRNGRCLATSQNSARYNQWSIIIVTTCNGNESQKWNVDPDPVGAALGDFVELSAAG